MEPTNQQNLTPEENAEQKPAQFDALMEFLDAETYEEKLELLQKMQFDLNDYLIDTMAISVDVVIPEGDIDDRYRQLKGCLEAKRKYEINRFRLPDEKPEL